MRVCQYVEADLIDLYKFQTGDDQDHLVNRVQFHKTIRNTVKHRA